ncbi:MAG: FHA domain-containing protein [Deltaproteobacteria bacterium]|nr:MAG: FHA domain-containing protein [Deltaproteobacteria bacterium]
MLRIELVHDGKVLHTHPLDVRPVHVGRATTNDLVLAEPRVSSRHLVIWVEGGAVYVEDLGSRNGTTTGGEPLTGRAELAVGRPVVLGEVVTLRVVGELDEDLPLAVVVRGLDSGVEVPVLADQLRFGSAPTCDVRLPEASPVALVLLHVDGEWVLGEDGETRPVALGQAFTVGGQRFALWAASGGATRTEGLEQARFPYALAVSLNGPTGARAVLQQRRSGEVHTVTSEVRATLLFVLARKLSDDLAAGLPADERGWMHDDDVAAGIWGRERFAQEANNYHVLVHRVRRELEAAGFDPWFLEKKRKHLRLRLDEVTVE